MALSGVGTALMAVFLGLAALAQVSGLSAEACEHSVCTWLYPIKRLTVSHNTHSTHSHILAHTLYVRWQINDPDPIVWMVNGSAQWSI